MFRGHQKQFNPKAVLNNLMVSILEIIQTVKNEHVGTTRGSQPYRGVLFVNEKQKVAKLIQHNTRNRMVGIF